MLDNRRSQPESPVSQRASPKSPATPRKTARAAGDFTIDQLAQEAGSTVRNVRAYQDRGLLPPPEKRGRTAYYSAAHLGRLRLIGQLLARGYTLANISELIAVLEHGHDLRSILGLEAAISSPWSKEAPQYFTLPQLLAMFSVPFNPRTLAKVIELGILEPDGAKYRAPNPKILRAGAELTSLGIPLEQMLTIVEKLRGNVERVADEMVQLLVRMLDHYGEGKLPPRQDIPRLADLIWRLRPLADLAIEAEVSRALERSANRFLGDRVAQILEHLRDKPREA